MKWLGSFVALGAALAVLFLTSGCSSEESEPVDPSRRPGNAADGFPLERALVACFQDNGIDAELFPNGSIHIDSQGTLSKEEYDALDQLCDQRVEDQGFILHEEPTDESRQRNYNDHITLRECLVEKGYAIPELPSFETFVAHPGKATSLFGHVIRESGVAIVEDINTCPYQSLVRAVAIKPAE